MVRTLFASAAAAVVAASTLATARAAGATRSAAGSIQFVFTSDAHYGLTRPAFRGATTVDARAVNRALVASINQLSRLTFPADDGVAAGARVGPVDFVVEGGDVSNREDVIDGRAIERAEVTWQKFRDDYGELTLTDRAGGATPLFVVPGNHESSNAIGYYKPMDPPKDPSALIAAYNLMMRPAAPLTAATFDYDRDRVHASRDIGGAHFVFLHVWPDSSGRAWMTADLERVAPTMPVLIFTHDPPEGDARHFINPNGAHDINTDDAFENILSDRLAEGPTTAAGTLVEQSALESFLAVHPNITAYFHGHANFNQFYDWAGPHHAIALHAFRVDSPMKGAVSKDDETKLSFQIATIDMASCTMTVREVLWNAHPERPSLTWGESTSVLIGRREKQ